MQKTCEATPSTGREADALTNTRLPVWRAVLFVAFIAVTTMICVVQPKEIGVGSLPGVKMSLPHQIGEYWGYDQEVGAAERLLLPEDTEFARKEYSNLSGESVFCSIVLAGAQRQSIHRPEVCLPAQGWSIRDRRTETAALDGGRKIDMSVLTLVRPVQLSNGQTVEIRQLYAYWFVGRTRMTPSHESRIFESMLDRVFQGISHRWAYVTVNTMVGESIKPGGKNEAETLELIKDFVSEAAPSFITSEAFGESVEGKSVAAK